MSRLAETTAQKLAETRSCLAATHRCIELSRRLLNPAWAISGGSHVDSRHFIRDRLERGALSLASGSIATRWGNGEVCVICDHVIAWTEVANGSRGDDGQAWWTHVVCLRLWREESAAYELRQIERERSARAELCATVRAGFANGSIQVLPHQRPRLGRGTKGPCSVCRKVISPNEPAYEVVGGVLGRAAYAHSICYRVWWIESMAHRRSQT
jgi:hypothetical protein